MAKELLNLDGPDVICHYVYDSDNKTIYTFVKWLNNSGEDIFAEFTNNQFDDQTIVVSSTTHDAAGIDFIVRQQLLMFNQDVSGV